MGKDLMSVKGSGGGKSVDDLWSARGSKPNPDPASVRGSGAKAGDRMTVTVQHRSPSKRGS